VLGGEHVGLSIAERLQADGHAVTVIDERYGSADVPGIEGSPTDVALLTEAGLETASSAIVSTGSDARNFLIAQLVSVNFDVPRIVVLVHDPERVPLLAEAGYEPFCVPTALSEMVGRNA
jgi:trk system potassium uptake protein TrkA